MNYHQLKTFVACLLIVMCANRVVAQEGQAKKLLEEAKEQMAKGNYLGADQKFRKILSLNEVVPTEALYFFAYTLDKNNELQSSRNFLDKYLELTGKSGEYYNEAKILTSKLDKKYAEIAACNFCDADGLRLILCPVCEGAGKIDGKCTQCHGFGQTTCNKCLGEGVQITRTSFGENSYKTCEVCNGTGKETCSRCNGAKHLVQECPRCFGKGRIGSDVVCNHKEHALPVAPARNNE